MLCCWCVLCLFLVVIFVYCGVSSSELIILPCVMYVGSEMLILRQQLMLG